MDDYFRVNEPDVTFEAFEGEILAINLRNGNYYSIREAGVPIWLLIARGKGVTEIERELARSCQGDDSIIATEVRTFVHELETDALIVRGPMAAQPMGDQTAVILPAKFTGPIFDRYTDMQQLLLMDPIHEVDVTGCPAKAKDAG